MALLPFFSMTALQAANLNQATAGQQHVLDPRRVEAGPYAGKYVVPTAVETDEAYVALRPTFAVLTRVGIETDEAWPQTEE